jgi:hypothetical protein
MFNVISIPEILRQFQSEAMSTWELVTAAA